MSQLTYYASRMSSWATWSTTASLRGFDPECQYPTTICIASGLLETRCRRMD
jgi:hypothetical protein